MAAILGLGRRVTSAAAVHSNHCRANPKVFTGQPVVGFGVKAGISQHPIEVYIAAGLYDCAGELRGVVVRSPRHDTGTKQMCLCVTDGRHLGPGGVMVRAFALALQIMGADVMRLEASAVDSSFRRLADHLEGLGAVKNSVQEAFKSPFFCSRLSA